MQEILHYLHTCIIINSLSIRTILLTLVRRTGKMIGTESEKKKIVLKKKDMKKTRKKLNTLTKDSAPVFGTSLCILERFVYIV